MTKRVLSAAAAVAIMTTGAMAFDTNHAGDILNRDAKQGKYINGTAADEALLRSTDTATTDRLKGDALIFPAFQADDEGWKTDIVLRNNYTDRAVVAKAVIYAGHDSSEVRDFNIYLSANDQARFTLQDGEVVSNDSSIVISETVKTNKTVVFADDNNQFTGKLQDIESEAYIRNGYIIVYGMFETDGTNKGYDHNHTALWEKYRDLMDFHRDGWRDYKTTMRKGVYTEANITSPNVDVNDTSHVAGVGANALSGTVRIYNANTETRDMLLPATALENYTPNNNSDRVMLWAPNEYAAIADRCIDGDEGATNGDYAGYNKDCVQEDTVTFLIDNATYTYENKNGKGVANKLIMTQPTKRFLTQLDPNQADNEFWHDGKDDNCEEPANKKVVTGTGYGIVANLNIFGDDEETFGKAPESEEDPELLTSPGDLVEVPAQTLTALCNELAVASDIEQNLVDPATGTKWPETSNGFVRYDFANESGQIPAIVTQMTATRVNGEAKSNWVYAPSDRKQN